MQPGAVPRGVIVADDSPIIRSNLRDALGRPWHVFLAANGAEAVDYARDFQAELVLLDFRMPRLDGLKAAELIREVPGYAVVPIVLLTAYDCPDLRRLAAQSGITSVFAKPFSFDVLREAVIPLVALGRDTARGQPVTVPPESSATGTAAGLDAARDVLAVYRRMDQSAEQRHYGSFAEHMSARRARLLR